MTGLPVARPFALDELRSLPPTALDVSLDVARVLTRLPHPLTLTLSGLGEVEIEFDRLDVENQTDEAMEGLALEMDGSERGELSLECALALELVSAACGRPRSPLLRPLSQGERGILAALMLSGLEIIGVRRALRLALRPGPAVGSGVVSIGFSMTSPGGIRGRGHLRVPTSWSSQLKLPGAPGVRSRCARFPVSIELARTRLTSSDLAAIQLGDGVVFGGYPSVTVGSDWPLSLRVGELEMRARWCADGTIRIATGIFEHKEVQRMDADDGDTQVELPSAEHILAATPVAVVAEIGRIVLRGDELAGLVPGAVLSLGQRAADSIALRIEGRLWARGQLVRVGDELAVRITQLIGG